MTVQRPVILYSSSGYRSPCTMIFEATLDVAVACGFKTQQHFAQVFRDFCGVSPTEYRQDIVGSEATGAWETGSEENIRHAW
jgi:Helix-turn-helix domain